MTNLQDGTSKSLFTVKVRNLKLFLAKTAGYLVRIKASNDRGGQKLVTWQIIWTDVLFFVFGNFVCSSHQIHELWTRNWQDDLSSCLEGGCSLMTVDDDDDRWWWWKDMQIPRPVLAAEVFMHFFIIFFFWYVLTSQLKNKPLTRYNYKQDTTTNKKCCTYLDWWLAIKVSTILRDLVPSLCIEIPYL